MYKCYAGDNVVGSQAYLVHMVNTGSSDGSWIPFVIPENAASHGSVRRNI